MQKNASLMTTSFPCSKSPRHKSSLQFCAQKAKQMNKPQQSEEKATSISGCINRNLIAFTILQWIGVKRMRAEVTFQTYSKQAFSSLYNGLTVQICQ